jgi:XapX domain-containing protein
MQYILSLGVGFIVGGLYAALGMRSPAPPIVALLGLLGMLTGEQVVAYLKGHPAALTDLLHSKSFAHGRSVAQVADEAPMRKGQ